MANWVNPPLTLSEETLDELNASREQIKQGEARSLDEVAEKFEVDLNAEQTPRQTSRSPIRFVSNPGYISEVAVASEHRLIALQSSRRDHCISLPDTWPLALFRIGHSLTEKAASTLRDAWRQIRQQMRFEDRIYSLTFVDLAATVPTPI